MLSIELEGANQYGYELTSSVPLPREIYSAPREKCSLSENHFPLRFTYKSSNQHIIPFSS